MKANGNVILKTAKDINNFKMVVYFKGSMSMENHKGWESINGPMENFMKENG